MGLLLVVAVITVPGWIPAFPKTLSTAGSWLSVAGMFLIAALFFRARYQTDGRPAAGFHPSFAAIFVLSALCQYVSMLPPIKTAGLESVFFSVILGLLIRNTVGLPKWLSPAVRSEYYIKIGLILLGTSVLFGEILKAGGFRYAPGRRRRLYRLVFHFLARQKAKNWTAKWALCWRAPYRSAAYRRR